MVVDVVPGIAERESGSAPLDRNSEALREQLDHVKGAFLASLNHEIRTPLSGIIGMLDLLHETELDEDQRDYLSAARVCTESLLELLNASLEFSALEAGQFRLDESEFSLKEMLGAALEQQQGKAKLKHLKLFLASDPNLPETMIGDAPRLREILGHLIGNAIKFTHTGAIEVRAAVKREGEKYRLVAVVRDTGIGIPQEKMGGIFDSFRQGESGLSRSYPGLGLGLAIARKLVTVMGGGIKAESELGSGSTFTIEVPLRRPAEAALVADTPRADSGPVILAVEDNPVGMTVLRHILQRRKMNVDCATSGREALDAATRRHYDLILMDLQMPEMNGLDASAAIRKLPGYERVPILALTANCADQVRDQCRVAGMQGFLSKPVDANELWATVTNYLQRDNAH